MIRLNDLNHLTLIQYREIWEVMSSVDFKQKERNMAVKFVVSGFSRFFDPKNRYNLGP